MFERYTERARQVIVLAQQAAHSMDHGHIGTEHLLHGLSSEGEGIAAKVLRDAGLSPEKIEDAIEAIIGRGTDGANEGQLPFTSRAKKVCELALREALSLGCNYIGTEHVLLGLVRENEGVGVRILQEASLDGEGVRNAVIRLLTGSAWAAKPVEQSYWVWIQHGPNEYVTAASREQAIERFAE